MIHETMRDRARQLRADATLFEQAFWHQVRAGRLGGYKFRRQQVIGPYIVDFVCQQARLVVELDGAHHQATREHDAQRDEWLRAEGYRVFRVWNNEWLAEPQGVLEKVWGVLQELRPSPQHPTPSPQHPTPSPQHPTLSPQHPMPSPQPLPPNGGGAIVATPLSLWGRGAGGEGCTGTRSGQRTDRIVGGKGIDEVDL